MPSLLEQIIPRRKLLLIASETAIFAGILYFGTSLPPLASRVDATPGDDTLRGVLSCVTIAILAQASLSYNDLYDWKVSQNRAELPNRLVHSLGYALVMLAFLVFLLPQLFHFPGLRDVSRETYKLILLLSLGFAAIWAWRKGFHWFFYKWNFGERVLVLGTGEQARGIAALIEDNPMSGYEVVGLVGSEPSPPDAPAYLRVLGNEEQLPSLARDNRVAIVIACYEERRGRLPVPGLLECRMEGVLVEEREAMYERVTGKIAVESLRPSYLIFGHGFSKPPMALAFKRSIDVLVSAVGLVVAAPICVVAAIAIKLNSRGPIFFSQHRVGEDGRLFSVIKFRTMRHNAEASTGPVWAATNDNRVTRVGRILRLMRIDEIPQMVNVLAGNMSFVGPRPERPYFVEQLSEANPYYPLRHTVKPGITGWAQVRHPYGASVEDALEKLRYDLYYIKNMSIVFDLNIILRTVGVILFGKGAR
ncbi:MAG: TIGR03013 family XrtA/PEP-CTERM system glycosyltransferase [Planctomycetota bacterium]